MASSASSSYLSRLRSPPFSPSLRRLGFGGAAFSVNESSSAIADPIDVNQSTNGNAQIRPAVPAGKHSINHTSVVRKKIEDMTYHLINVKSNHRHIHFSSASGSITVPVNLLSSRSFCSHPSNLINKSQGPAAIDYRSVLQEDEFHKLADSTIHDMLEKLEEYGDSIDIDGFDIDYGNEVLTLKLGDLGTYVINKQSPNRQIWLSSPVSGPSRFDWDPEIEAWIYRRNQVNLCKVLENELEKLCGKPLKLL